MEYSRPVMKCFLDTGSVLSFSDGLKRVEYDGDFFSYCMHIISLKHAVLS